MSTRRMLAAGAILAGLLPFAAHAQDRGKLMQLHRGGTLKLTASGAAGTIDPQINYELKYWQLYQCCVYDGLLTFKKVTGPASNTVVPDLAEAMPKVTDGGKTYVFKLRTGIKFSNGQELTGKDVVASFQRLFKVNNPNAGSWFNSIVGSDKCLKDGASCTLEGGVLADDSAHTITMHLTDPSSEFLFQLATPFGTILPASTPAKDLGTHPAPGTGAYMFADYDPNKGLKLVRNPYFKEFSADAQPDGYPDEIDYSFGLQDEAEVTAVLNNQFDWMFDETPLDRLSELGSKHRTLLHVHPLLAYYYAPMNVNIAPFNNLKARQAVAYAVDRNAMVKLWGGPNLASPLCQQLPAGMPGFQPYCPFTKNPTTAGKWTAPDLAKAKQLVQESGTKGQKVTLVSSDKVKEKSIGEYLASVLRTIGYDAQPKALSSNIQYPYIQNSKNSVQISLTDWYQDYPAASDFIYVLFSCDSIHPGSEASPNISAWCDKSADAAMKKALATAVTNVDAAASMWAKIDKQVTDAVPAVSLFQPKATDLVAPRVRNYVWSDQIHMLFDQAWVR